MNLFVLAQLAASAAKYHCDKHCIKMILETCQLLYTAHYYNTPEPIWTNDCPHAPYKMTHKNHPCSVWVRAKKAHYDWAVNLGFELCKEYKRRYGKEHKCYTHLLRLKTMGYPEKNSKSLIETYTAPAHKRATYNCPKGCDYFDCAINDKYFDNCAVYVDGKLDCVQTYRNYYLTKEWELKWNKGKDNQPLWYKIKCLSCSNDYQCAMCWYDAPNKKRTREDNAADGLLQLSKKTKIF